VGSFAGYVPVNVEMTVRDRVVPVTPERVAAAEAAQGEPAAPTGAVASDRFRRVLRAAGEVPARGRAVRREGAVDADRAERATRRKTRLRSSHTLLAVATRSARSESASSRYVAVPAPGRAPIRYASPAQPVPGDGGPDGTADRERYARRAAARAGDTGHREHSPTVPSARGERAERSTVPHAPDQADRRLRPLRRRRATTARPPRVRIRTRKPCVLLRLRLFGWNVLFTHRLLGRRGRGGPGRRAHPGKEQGRDGRGSVRPRANRQQSGSRRVCALARDAPQRSCSRPEPDRYPPREPVRRPIPGLVAPLVGFPQGLLGCPRSARPSHGTSPRWSLPCTGHRVSRSAPEAPWARERRPSPHMWIRLWTTGTCGGNGSGR
jgi:hypothetical protein